MSVARQDVERLVSNLGRRAAVLHGPPGWDPVDGGGGDVDCVVADLDPSWPLRLDHGWSLCQSLHYDITGRYWVLERDGEVLKLDTLDDPDGIGRFGVASRGALADGATVPAHARAAYLTAKRLRKADGDGASWAEIRALAGEGPGPYRHAVSDVVGRSVGHPLAEAVLEGGLPSDELRRRARRAQRWRRFRSPARMARIPTLELARVLGRIGRPTGMVVLVVGPDGSGKSTLARALPGACRGLFRRHAVVHWRPGFLPRPGALLGRDPRGVSEPHAMPAHGRGASIALLSYHWLDFFIGGWLRVHPSRVRTGLVVMERGWWDIVVDPARYRLAVAPAIVRPMGSVLPRPDLAFVLDAPAELIRSRKPELTTTEIRRQQGAWRRALPSGVRTVTLDGSASIDDVVRSARSEIVRTLEARTARRLASGWASLPGARRPRWLLPRGPRSVARNAVLLYQPVTPIGLTGWRLARFAASLGGFRLLPRGAAPPRAVRAAAAPFVPRGGAIAVARSNHPGRFLVLVLGPDGADVAVVKVALESGGRAALAREADALEAFSDSVPLPLRMPDVLGRGDGVLALRAVRWRPRERPWELPGPVAEALGTLFGRGAGVDRGVGHGDVAPWNLLETRDGWTLVDWEQAADDALPFDDPFHFVVQSHALLGRPRTQEIVRALGGDGDLGAALRAYGEAAGLAFEEASAWFERYLDASAERLDPSAADGRAGLRARRRLRAAMRSMS